MGQVKRDSIINTIITYGGIGLGYLNKGLLFPLLLLPEQVGLANVVILIVAFFSQLSNFGTGMILLRFLPFMKGKEAGYSGILFFAASLLVGGIGLISLILLVFHEPILGYFSERSPMLIDYSLWIIPLGIASAFFTLFEAYLRAISKNLVSVLIQDFVLRVAVFISLGALYFSFLNFEQFILFYFAIHFLPAFFLSVYIVWLKQFFISAKHLQIQKKLRLYMLNYGLIVYFNTFGRNVILMADAIMLSAMSGLKEVGVFTTMVFLSNALFVPYVSMIRISSPFVPKYWRKRDMKAMSELYKRVTAVGFFITSALFTFVWFNIDLVLSYLPKEYADGKYIFLFLMLGRMCDAIGGLNGDILLTSKKFKIEIGLTIPLVLIVFVLNYWLIPIYAGIGAALVTGLVYFAYNLLRLVLNQFYFKLNPFDVRFVKLLFLIGITIGSCLLIEPIFSGFTRLILTMLVLLTFYIYPVYKLKLVPDLSTFTDQLFSKLKLK